MKKLVLALVMCFSLPAFAAGSDGGVEETKKCAGFTVNGEEARAFTTYYGALIIAVSQTGSISALVPDSKQTVVVEVLKKFDLAGKKNYNGFCIDVSADQADLTLEVADTLSKKIEKDHAENTLGEILLMLTKGNRDKVVTLLGQVSQVAAKMYTYVSNHGSL